MSSFSWFCSSSTFSKPEEQTRPSQTSGAKPDLKPRRRQKPASTVLNEVSNHFCLVVRHLEDIAEAVKNDLDDLGILHHQQVAKGRNHLLLDQVSHLILSTTYCQVADGPGCFLLSSKVTLEDTHSRAEAFSGTFGLTETGLVGTLSSR